MNSVNGSLLAISFAKENMGESHIAERSETFAPAVTREQSLDAANRSGQRVVNRL